MAKKDKYSRVQTRRITPTAGMREYLGDGSFRMVMLVTLLFAFLHQRVIISELQYGSGGLWCSLGTPAVICLVISVVFTFLGAKTRLLPALVPIIGLGGIGTSLIMFAVIIIGRMHQSEGLLGALQEISMLAFLASWMICILLLMLTGIGMKVAPAAGIPAAVLTVIALILFVVRAMYIFSSLITALSRNLLLPDAEMADEIQWVLRSVAPGGEEARGIYFDRLLDSIGTALLMMCCVPPAIRFNGFFAEQAMMLKNIKDIPLPTQYRRVYTGYDEYTEDVPAEAAEESFDVTRDGYYVEKKVTDRPKFKRRERTERSSELNETIELVPEPVEDLPEPEEQEFEDTSEYYDYYVPGEGWSSFIGRALADEQQETAAEKNAQPVERKHVKAVQASKPVVDPKDPSFWNQYSE